MGANILDLDSTIYAFKDYLVQKGMITTLRITRGDAIDGAAVNLLAELKRVSKEG